MIILKLLLNIGLILATRTISSLGNNVKIIDRLPNNTIPVHYDINITPYLEEGNFTFYGESNVKIKIRYITSTISLHSRELKINETATKVIKDKDTTYRPLKHIHDNQTNILSIIFIGIITPGPYILHMEFAGNLLPVSQRRGFIKFSYINDKENNTKWLAVTNFEPNGARLMLPCWDEPALKATFDISVKHSQKYGVLSNMPIREQFLEQDGMLRTNFHTTPLMSTYIVAIAMSEFVRVPNANETINMWCKSSLTSKVTFSHSVAEKVVEFLIEYTNSSQKVPKMDHILIPNFVVGGMENWGLITYRESGIIYDNSDPIYQKTEAALVVAHELAHQWFGNLVTPSWWPYLWLSEGFASFFESYTIDKIFKDWRRMDLFVIQTMQQCFLKDTGLLNSVTLKIGNTLDEKSLFSTEVYKKAPVLLRMLHNTITAEVFRKGLITYLATHQFSTATPDDLWSAMQSALDESDVPHEGYRIKEVMDTWMNQERYPFVHVERNYETGEVTISQSCVRQHGETEMKTTKWWIPITFATQSNLDFSNTVPRYWLRPDQHNISFIINPNDWIIVNLQLTGYYRVSYDTTNWYKILNYLNSIKYTNIHVLNRVQIIIDSFIMVLDDRINGYIFIQLISYLFKDKDYIAWQSLVYIIQNNVFVLPEVKHIKIRFEQLFDRLFRYVGYVEDPNDDHITKLTRLYALQMACFFGHEECKKMSALKLSEYLANHEIHKIPSFMYCTGMMTASRTTWDKMLELYLNKEIHLKEQDYDKRLLWGLSCAENPNIVKDYLNMAARNTSLFPNTDHSFIFNFIIRKHVNNDIILDYILNNFMILKPIPLTIPAVLKLILQNVYVNEQVDKVNFMILEIHILINFILTMYSALVQTAQNLATTFLRCDVIAILVKILLYFYGALEIKPAHHMELSFNLTAIAHGSTPQQLNLLNATINNTIQTFSTNFNLPSNTSSIVQKLIEQRKELLKKATDDAIKQFYYTTQ